MWDGLRLGVIVVVEGEASKRAVKVTYSVLILRGRCEVLLLRTTSSEFRSCDGGLLTTGGAGRLEAGGRWGITEEGSVPLGDV